MSVKNGPFANCDGECKKIPILALTKRCLDFERRLNEFALTMDMFDDEANHRVVCHKYILLVIETPKCNTVRILPPFVPNLQEFYGLSDKDVA